MFKKNLILLMIIALSFIIHIDSASAAPKLEVDAEIGVSNMVKYNAPVSIKMTITNNGSSFSGDLVIDTAASYSSGSAHVYPLDLPEGETKTITVYLDALSEEYGYNYRLDELLYFYEGGIEKGKQVKFTNDTMIRPHFYDPYSSFVFTLTENSDRLGALLRLSQYVNNDIEIFHLNQIPNYEFPTDVRGLSMANILIVDETSISDLAEEKQQALLEWVEEGGTLLVGASDQVNQALGIFTKYLPLNLSSEKVTVSNSVLEKLSIGGTFTENIEVYRATEKEGSTTIFADGNTILASSADVGKGHIIQTAFSLGDEPLSKMDGYAKLLSELLKDSLNRNYSGYSMGYLEYLPQEMGRINELYPSFQVSTTGLIVVTVVYILLIGPILYLVLRRLDKREHSWWLIPLVSILLTLSIFIVGAKDRIMQSQINQSAFYRVDGNTLSGYYVQSLLTNRGGDFVYTTDKNTTAIATKEHGLADSGRLHEKSYVETHAGGSTLHLRNLNYWSVQSVVGKTTIPNAGNFEMDLTLTNSELKGTIKNNFPFPLKDVMILSGNREIEIGNLEPNETMNISKEVKSHLLVRPSLSNYYYWNMPQKKEELIPKRIEHLKENATNLFADDDRPVIVGWTEEALVGIELDGSAEVSPIALIMQPFTPKVELKGEFTVDNELFQEHVIPINNGWSDLHNETNNEWYLDPGDYEYNVFIPDDLLSGKYEWKEIKITNHAMKRLTLSIWNFETSSYEEISEKELTISGNIQQYIAPHGEIRMFVKTADDDIYHAPVKMPKVEMKGAAKE